MAWVAADHRPWRFGSRKAVITTCNAQLNPADGWLPRFIGGPAPTD